MKFSYSLLFFSLLLFAACSVSKKPEDSSTKEEREFRSGLNNSDSVQVLELSNSVMELLKQQDYELAFAQFNVLDDGGNVMPLSSVETKRLMRRFSMFPVKEYQLREFVFNTQSQNIVIYDVLFEEPEDGKTKSITTFGFSPVKYNGHWYLTIRGSATSDGHDVK